MSQPCIYMADRQTDCPLDDRALIGCCLSLSCLASDKLVRKCQQNRKQEHNSLLAIIMQNIVHQFPSGAVFIFCAFSIGAKDKGRICYRTGSWIILIQLTLCSFLKSGSLAVAYCQFVPLLWVVEHGGFYAYPVIEDGKSRNKIHAD